MHSECLVNVSTATTTPTSNLKIVFWVLKLNFMYNQQQRLQVGIQKCLKAPKPKTYS